MNSAQHTARTSNDDGSSTSAFLSTASQLLKPVTSEKSRRLTPSEVALLQRSKQETADFADGYFRQRRAK